jgi:hypothetical protein
MARERRWIVLTADGRHATLRRTAEPTEAEVAQAASALAAAGLTGWLATMEGEYWSRRRPLVLTPLRLLTGASDSDWQTAATAFHVTRSAAITTS